MQPPFHLSRCQNKPHVSTRHNRNLQWSYVSDKTERTCKLSN
jgi:hypothetical protein